MELSPRAKIFRCVCVLTPAAAILTALPVAAWLTFGWTSGADSASSRPPTDLEAEVPPRQFIRAHAMADSVLEERARNRREETTIQVARGDTLMELLQDAGIGRSQAYEAITALEEVYSPRNLKPGQNIRLALLHDDASPDGDAAPRLASLGLRASVETDVSVRRAPDGSFVAKAVPHTLSQNVDAAHGAIESSLFAAGDRENVPVEIMLEMLHAYSFQVDFQRDLQPGDRFEVVYESYTEADGELAKTGPLLFASLVLQGEELEMYRYETRDGETDYFTPDGESVRRLLMRTPVDGARLSSGFGMRKHPILGYSRMHKGIDFAAPGGTPVYAAGNGKVVQAGRNGGYGNFLKIRHADGFETAYAHLSGFADGVRSGARVQQGEVVAYVGSTGRSTGPHLHYEILRHGKHVNPQDLELPTGRTLAGKELDRFLAAKTDIDRLRRNLPGATRLASADCRKGDAEGC